MTYEDTLRYLYTSTPVFQHSGASAYKPGLGTSIALDDYLGNPHKAYPSIHVGGTNGKGSVCHLLAAILRQAGYKVGLYTSPHLLDFRERIRVNGKMIPKEYVVDFVERHRAVFEPLHPSFFELTSTLAFDYFRSERVDFAVVEVGMGGRLDSTNIITPILSIVTNVSLDHTQFLGDTLEKIAFEKAGIIKPRVPAIVGEVYQGSVAEVFLGAGAKSNATICFASKRKDLMKEAHIGEDLKWHFDTVKYGPITGELGGIMQDKNANTVLAALDTLENIGIDIPREAVEEGFGHVVELTGLMGRWQTLREKPRVICDTGHNPDAWRYLGEHLKKVIQQGGNTYMVVGMVSDKDIDGVMELMPKEATYFFTQASVERAMPAKEFAAKAATHGLEGGVYEKVTDAVRHALEEAREDDTIFIGGSTFVLADALPLFMNRQ